MKAIRKDKRGFSTLMTIVGGAIGLVFLVLFGSLFIQYLTDDGVTGSGTNADTLGDTFAANYSTAATDVAGQLPTVFSIGVLVLIISRTK